MRADMTDAQCIQMLVLINALWKKSAPWDVIVDMQAFIQGRPTIVQMTAEEWIRYAEKLLVGSAESEWIDITTIGCIYEEQVERYSGAKRHRLLMPQGGFLNGDESAHGEWIVGSAPPVKV